MCHSKGKHTSASSLCTAHTRATWSAVWRGTGDGFKVRLALG
eukprot:gene56257-57000_t